MREVDLSSLPVLRYPAPTEDLEKAKANIDEFGIALVANALSPEASATSEPSADTMAPACRPHRSTAIASRSGC